MRVPKPRIKEENVRGELKYVVHYKPAGQKRKRIYCDTKKEAERELASLQTQLNQTGQAFAMLDAVERAELARIYSEIRKAGRTLAEVWLAFQAGLLKGDVVVQRRTCQEVIKEIEKDAVWLRNGYRHRKESSRHWRNLCKGNMGAFVDQITMAQVEAYLDGCTDSDSSRMTTLGRVSLLFSFAKRKGYVRVNPCDNVPRFKVKKKTPTILSPEQYRKLLIKTLCECPRAMGFVACNLIVGMRPEETVFNTLAEKPIAAGWKHIFLDRKVMVVRDEASKTETRIINLNDRQVAWLQLAKDCGAKLPLGKNTYRRYLKKLRKMMGWEVWPQDILRHTAASYQHAAGDSKEAIAAQLGNSKQMLDKHYITVDYRRSDGTAGVLFGDVAAKMLSFVPSARMKRFVNERTHIPYRVRRGNSDYLLRENLRLAA